MANRWGKNVNSERLSFLKLQNHCRWKWLQPRNWKIVAPWKRSYDKPRQHIKSGDITLPTKVLIVKVVVFPVVMYWCKIWTIKKTWVLKNWCVQTVVLENTLESPLGCKEIKPVNPKGNQSCIFIERTDAEAEPPISWLLDTKSWLIGKDPDAGKDWKQKGVADDELIR